jgi:hypothetical protein
MADEKVEGKPVDELLEKSPEQKLQEIQKLDFEVSAKKAELERLDAEGKAKTVEEQSRRDALRQEYDRLLTDVTRMREEKRKKDETFQERFRREQLEKAQERFFKEFGYEDYKLKDELMANFEKYDSGSLDSENIYRDLKRAHVAMNPDKYIEIENRVKRSQEAAKAAMADASGSAFAQGSLPEGDFTDLDADDIQAIRWSGMPVEKYRELKRAGKI